MAATFAGFPPEALEFLRQLKRHNNREWFLKNKAAYEAKVKAPMVDLVLALGREMKPFAPEMITDPARAIYRIYRDTRFSPDKTPYKTHVAAVFKPRNMEKHNCAGLYFHVAPEFRRLFGELWGAKLTRAPKGFPADHPAAELLRYKQMLADVSHPARLAETPKLLPTIVDLFRGMMPLLRFLNAPLAGQLRDRPIHLED